MRKLEVIGNLGRDAELKSLQDGTPVLNFSVAAKGSKKDDEGLWHSCSMFGKRAESLSEYMKKGQKVFVRGEYKIRQWSANGKSGVDLDVRVDDVELLGERKKEEASAPSMDPDSDFP